MPHRLSLRRMSPTPSKKRAPQICIIGSAEPGSTAYELAGAAGEMLARWAKGVGSRLLTDSLRPALSAPVRSLHSGRSYGRWCRR